MNVPLRRARLGFPAATVGPLLLVGCMTLRPAERAGWQSDLDTLIAHLPTGYANLEFAVRDAQLDVAAAARRAHDQVGRARSARGARRAIASFLRTFQDPHVSLRSPSVRSAGDGGPARSCTDLGFRGRGRTFHRAVRDLPGFRGDSGYAFGLAHAEASGTPVIAVRIPLLSADAYPEVCERLYASHAAADGACDGACTRAVYRAVEAAALESWRAPLVAAARDSAVLLLDLTGNGGGSEWALAFARRLTPLAVAAPQVGLVRHAHTRQGLERRRAAFAAIVGDPTAPGGARAAAATVVARTDSLLRVLDIPCDWRPVLRGDAPPDCSPLIRDAMPLLSAESTAAWGDAGRRFDASPPAQAVLWRGPIVIVTDHQTASAAELFTAALLDAGAAIQTGAPTMGAGCGFIDGGIDFRLPHSGLQVRLPDCARFRRTGSNERAGLAPGPDVRWDDPGAGARSAAIERAIRRAREGR